jgi:hypothetical protein
MNCTQSVFMRKQFREHVAHSKHSTCLLERADDTSGRSALIMHRVLSIAELLSLILLYHEYDRRTLVRIGGTNKALMLAALPLLWRHMDSIIPLLQLLPNDAVSLERESPGLRRWIFVSGSQHFVIVQTHSSDGPYRTSVQGERHIRSRMAKIRSSCSTRPQLNAP